MHAAQVLCGLVKLVAVVVGYRFDFLIRPAACKARKDGDAILFAKIWDDAIEAWANEEIEAVADNYGYELYQAAKHLCRVHAEPKREAA